jgi:hypothetical protein
LVFALGACSPVEVERIPEYEDMGQPGPMGPQGLSGPRGAPGMPGQPGRDGADGIDGLDGLNGQDGLRGPQGERGPQGLPGVKGSSCSVRQQQGTVVILCEDGTSATIPTVVAQQPTADREVYPQTYYVDHRQVYDILRFSTAAFPGVSTFEVLVTYDILPEYLIPGENNTGVALNCNGGDINTYNHIRSISRDPTVSIAGQMILSCYPVDGEIHVFLGSADTGTHKGTVNNISTKVL